MTSTSVHRRRALAARLLPFLVVFGSIPLMAPSCGSSGEGPRVFSRRSLIIPMDVCFQYMDDASQTSYGAAPYIPAGNTATTNTACPSVDPGDVMKAYGLVYQLIRNGIAVYWVIEDTKQAVADVDLTIQYPGGFPVFLFDWGTGLEGAAPVASLPGDKRTINYRGGPFVVDGADFDRASRVLQSLRANFGNVNVHVSNVAFRGYSKRTMAGGWSAGGAIPPKLALLDIGSSGSGSKNSEVVIRGYLTAAGLDTPGAMGYADESKGPHGEIFDRLFLPDFLGTPAGQPWTTSRLAQNEYQILWIPHWLAPGSCRDCPPSTSCTCVDKYPVSEIAETLRNIGSFVSSVNPLTGTRGDLFAECAGLGSFEGVFRYAEDDTSAYRTSYVLASQMATGGEPSTHFQSEGTTGFWINKWTSNPVYRGYFNSPLMQIGDYPFTPFSGAIQNFKPTSYKSSGEVRRLISEESDSTYDVFTWLPASASHGTVVYLGGHSYTDSDGDFQVAGSRLVLNTLFNLGASCTADGVACQTGLPGVCATGRYTCGTGPDPICVPDVQPEQRQEICNGLDDNCNGQVDEGLQTECYDPPPGYVDPDGRSSVDFAASRRVGLCMPGLKSCQRNTDGTYGMTSCDGQRLPAAETCDGYDDDCDGVVDDGIAPRTCYDGPQTTLNVGECRPGLQLCNLGQWGAFDPAAVPSVFVPGQCGGEVLPRGEVCNDSGAPGGAKDDDCDGAVNNGCTCNAGPPAQTQQCFTGPGTVGVGRCQAGTQTCQVGGFWSTCAGQVVATATESCVSAAIYASADCVNYPATTACRQYDTNCDNRVEKCRDCSLGDTQAPCPLEALPVLSGGSTWGVGQCTRGSRACTAEGTWGACTGYVLPSADGDGPIEYCDGQDNDCDGFIDENATCPTGQTCIRGVCVQQFCGTERSPPEGYSCSPTLDPSGLHTVVSAGCGDLPAPGCDIGQVCSYGNCVEPCPVSLDPNTLQTTSAVCGTGTVCGGGACIGGSCYETGCPDVGNEKQLCLSGACQPDPCAGKLCPSGAFCRQGDCVQACTFVTCYTGEKCGQDGFCEPDACAGKLCGAGQKCLAGACIVDPCLGKGCAAGQICVASGTTPLCVDDPCAGVICPAGECGGGQCFRSGNPTGAGTASRTEKTSSKGCGCGSDSGTGAALPALLALFLVPLARRRRQATTRGHGALLLVLVAVALTGAACKEKKTESQFDPSTCTATCPGEERCIDLATDPAHCGACGHACQAGYQCVDSVCGPASLIAPYLRSLTPSTAPKDAQVTAALAGDRFQEGATVRIGVGTAVSRTLACEAAAGDCQWTGTSALSVKLDLTGAAPGVPLVLRVVNPDGVISNTRTFGVTIPTPTVAGVVPSSVPSGSLTTVVVSGSGFTAGSSCRLGTIPGVGELPLTTRVTGAGAELSCDVPASVPNGSFTLTVASEPDGDGITHTSNGTALTVTPSDPVVYTVDPSTASTLAGFLISGTRFDLRTAKVLFQPPAGNVLAPAYVTTIDAGAILVHGLPVGAGTPYANGLYTVSVQNDLPGGASRISNGVSFSVGSQAAPTLTSFTPSTVFQGNPSQQLRFDGANITGSPQIEIQLPGASTYTPILPTTLSCAGVACTITATRSFVGAPEGSWAARVRFGSGASAATSAPWPLRVLSNQAILRDYAATPAPAQAGTVGEAKTSLSFTVSNIRGPDFTRVRVVLMDPAGLTTIATLRPNTDPTEATTTLLVQPVAPATSVLSLAGRDVGTYTFRVVNPNATPSNALPFTVNAGRPTLSSPVCLAGTSCTRYARQGDAAVTIRLVGTNFARPDANGNGSVVMAAADLSPATMAGWPDPDPCNTVATTGTRFQQVPGTVSVMSPTQIDVQVDTRSAFVDPSYGTTYYLGVWNPGGVAGLQKSSCGVDPRTLPWFRLCATDACAQ